ncbi:MAG: glycosyltransferase [Nitrospirota bacterium]|nr:glycosyltransferase [Nitrospirota bacterium]MDP3597986.1 glycosyltransferase [Nitrospirota bacterium]
MNWVNQFYSLPVTILLSLVSLFVISLLVWRNAGRGVILGLSLFLYLRYMVWRGIYTIPDETLTAMVVGWTVFLAELYGLFQYGFFAYQVWSPLDRTAPPLTTIPTVDMMVTVVHEPLDILKRTLVGCTHQEYPKDRFKVYVLDDGHRDEVRELAASLGCAYLRRPDRPLHAKAGNINHALTQSNGELVAMFDVDHVPSTSFLKETVGFFQDSKVAFVQTPHHFYNPDIFQRNLRLEQELKNEQALFFRMVQAGRDRHNSAFFAGSSGIFRRAPLEEIGGFQTQTISEDLHTSLILHSRGYQSRYLNKVLSVGLMPETLEGYLKQRTRWAIGSMQVLLRDNPLTIRGLTIAQRIDYFGSIFYFFFGIPRVICLLAPLAMLLFNVPPLNADLWPMAVMFFSFFVASIVAMRTVSRGSRNAFWSDIYEMTMCFALSEAVLKTLLFPWKAQPFIVTPKGQQVAKSARRELALVWPHLLIFGLLVMGITLGAHHWWQAGSTSGLGISLFWGCANLFLLTIALLVASEQSQVRRMFRIPRTFTSELQAGNQLIPATTIDINETGVALRVRHPLFTQLDSASVLFTTHSGERLQLKGRIVRQEPTVTGDVVVGIQFMSMDDHAMQALLVTIFSESSHWNMATLFKPSASHSLHSLIKALAVMWSPLVSRRRQIPRVSFRTPCRVDTIRNSFEGTTRDVSYQGLSVEFPPSLQESLVGAILHLQGVTLKVFPVETIARPGHTFVRFRIDHIEVGEERWRDLHTASWQRS